MRETVPLSPGERGDLLLVSERLSSGGESASPFWSGAYCPVMGRRWPWCGSRPRGGCVASSCSAREQLNAFTVDHLPPGVQPPGEATADDRAGGGARCQRSGLQRRSADRPLRRRQRGSGGRGRGGEEFLAVLAAIDARELPVRLLAVNGLRLSVLGATILPHCDPADGRRVGRLAFPFNAGIARGGFVELLLARGPWGAGRGRPVERGMTPPRSCARRCLAGRA